jgi:hypothetical protein
MTRQVENKELELAWQIIENTATSIFLTGKAGTGKTTFLRELKIHSPKRMVVLAPTGIAAINAGGATIHSFFQLPFSPYVPIAGNKEAKHKLNFQKEKRKIIRSLDLLVIDEISMVRADLLDAIDDVLRRIRKNNKPFGGVQLLMIGDLQQLSPVVKHDDYNILREYYNTFYFFGSHVLQKLNYKTLELKKVYRQSDSLFLSLLNKIRTNTADKHVLAALNERFIPDFDAKEGYIRLMTHNKQAQLFNENKLHEIKKESYTYHCTIRETFPEYMFPADEQLILKEGAQIMFLRNDTSPEKKFYNGKLGRIIELDEDYICVQCEDDKKTFVLEQEEWLNTKYVLDKENNEIIEHIEGSFKQYPIRLAWAITIHKSQGLTFEHAIIDAAAAFAHGQVYVALSRCKTLEGLVLTSKLNHKAIISDYQVEKFTQQSEQQSPTLDEINSLQQKYFIELLDEQFDFLPLYYSLQQVYLLLNTNFHQTYPKLIKQYKEHIDEFKKQTIEISFSFHKQYTHLALTTQHPENDKFLQQRVTKGANYFKKQITKWITELISQTNIEIDSKEIEKRFNTAITELNEKILIAITTLTFTAENGFSIKNYLKKKAEAAIQSENISRKTTKKKVAKIIIDATDDIKHIEVYNAILAWRKAKAEEENTPNYCVLQNKSMIGIANTLPSTADELLMIPGIGKIKVKKYGAAIIEIIEEYAGIQKTFFNT